jgi:hypothetical protein
VPKESLNWLEIGRAKGEFHAGVSDVTSPSSAEIDMDRGGVSDEVANENE